jgi:uncharacterized membrane protein HdeD (DUF308 family)
MVEAMLPEYPERNASPNSRPRARISREMMAIANPPYLGARQLALGAIRRAGDQSLADPVLVGGTRLGSRRNQPLFPLRGHSRSAPSLIGYDWDCWIRPNRLWRAKGSTEMSSHTDFEGIQRRLAAAIHAHWKLFLAQGIVMMVLGFLAVAVPTVATLAVEIFVGWLFLLAGVFRALSVWRSRQMPGFGWSMLTAVLAVVLGLILILRPLEGVLTLTMVLVAFFLVSGIASVLGAIEHRRHLRSWGWVLFSGIVDLLLAYLIWRGWPSSGTWAIGLLVGINMLFSGLSLVMTALTARAMGSN